MTKQNITNHVAIVLDASYSMDHLSKKVVEVTDKLIAHLAQDSKAKNQETRVSVYTFSDDVTCEIWDMDVLRLPSMAGLYKVLNNTALVDATVQALDDFDLITEKYGDHGFLMYVVTDGMENRSRGNNPPVYGYVPRDLLRKQLTQRIANLQENRTVVAFVPHDKSAQEVKYLGFPADNIAVWDASSEKGLEEAVTTIQQTYSSYSTARATGVKGTRNIFTLGAAVDAKEVKKNLTALSNKDYQIVPVVNTPDTFNWIEKRKNKQGEVIEKDKGRFVEIKKFVDYAHPPYKVGMAYYQLFTNDKRTREKIQGNKAIAVLDKRNSQVYTGDAARKVIGLPEYDITVKAESNPNFEIFVQSSSVNRYLPIGSRLLLITT